MASLNDRKKALAVLEQLTNAMLPTGTDRVVTLIGNIYFEHGMRFVMAFPEYARALDQQLRMGSGDTAVIIERARQFVEDHPLYHDEGVPA